MKKNKKKLITLVTTITAILTLWFVAETFDNLRWLTYSRANKRNIPDLNHHIVRIYLFPWEREELKKEALKTKTPNWHAVILSTYYLKIEKNNKKYNYWKKLADNTAEDSEKQNDYTTQYYKQSITGTFKRLISSDNKTKPIKL